MRYLFVFIPELDLGFCYDICKVRYSSIIGNRIRSNLIVRCLTFGLYIQTILFLEKRIDEFEYNDGVEFEICIKR